jgi:FAD dependent oxidoreductase
MNYDYPDGDYETRRKIIGQHEDYTKGLLYFLGNDPRVPLHLRDEMRQWGYPKDEYMDNGNFSHQLYIREARRMTGAYVMTQANCEGRETMTDGVGMAAYTMDSHNCQRVVVNGMAKNEGDVQAGGFGPYPVSYRALIPKEAECKNLLVPVCLSASHIAYGSIRMEPVFMVLGQSAAVAASMAIDSKSAVQKINVAALQNRLKANPLADNSLPEILIDDADKTNVQTKGDWKSGKLGRCYGASLLSDDDPKVFKSVNFTVTITKAGNYDAYVYSPEVSGKSSKLTVEIKVGQATKNFTLNTPKDFSDWLHLGRFNFPAGNHSVKITNQNADGLTIADAVLLVPVRK